MTFGKLRTFSVTSKNRSKKNGTLSLIFCESDYFGKSNTVDKEHLQYVTLDNLRENRTLSNIFENPSNSANRKWSKKLIFGNSSNSMIKICSVTSSKFRVIRKNRVLPKNTTFKNSPYNRQMKHLRSTLGKSNSVEHLRKFTVSASRPLSKHVQKIYTTPTTHSENLPRSWIRN